MDFLINKERKQIQCGNSLPKNGFTYMYGLLRSQKTKQKKTTELKQLSTTQLFEQKNYSKQLVKELATRPFVEMVAYFESIKPLKNKLFYWHPHKKINDPLSLLTRVFKPSELLKNMRAEKCRSLIFNCRGFDKFEGMLQERINIGDLKVLNEDCNFFVKYWTTKKGKLQEFYDYVEKFNVSVNRCKKNIDVIQRVITHPYWCDNNCKSSFSFLRTPNVRNLDFLAVDCFSYIEFEVENRTITVTFQEFNGLLNKDERYARLWLNFGITFLDDIEIE